MRCKVSAFFLNFQANWKVHNVIIFYQKNDNRCHEMNVQKEKFILLKWQLISTKKTLMYD